MYLPNFPKSENLILVMFVTSVALFLGGGMLILFLADDYFHVRIDEHYIGNCAMLILHENSEEIEIPEVCQAYYEYESVNRGHIHGPSCKKKHNVVKGLNNFQDYMYYEQPLQLSSPWLGN
jgi:hypothetical protein